MGSIAEWRESRQELVNCTQTIEISQSKQYRENRLKN